MAKKSLPDVIRKIGAWGIILWVVNYSSAHEGLFYGSSTTRIDENCSAFFVTQWNQRIITILMYQFSRRKLETFRKYVQRRSADLWLYVACIHRTNDESRITVFKTAVCKTIVSIVCVLWGLVLWVTNYPNRWESLKGQNFFFFRNTVLKISYSRIFLQLCTL